jgi:hypothetical protein
MSSNLSSYKSDDLGYILVGVEPNPGPRGRSSTTNPIVSALSTALVPVIRDAVSQSVVASSSIQKTQKKKVKRRARNRGNSGGNILGKINISKSIAPVSSFQTSSGVRMSFTRTSESDLTIVYSGYIALVDIAGSGSVSSAVNFDAFVWSNNYFNSSAGWSWMPIDPLAISNILNNFAKAFDMFRVRDTSLTYSGGCSTSTPGLIGFCTLMDPEDARVIGSNPSATSTYVQAFLASPSTQSFAPWTQEKTWAIQPWVSPEWFYTYEPNNQDPESLRSSCCAAVSVFGAGLPAQTSSVQLFGTLKISFICDLKGLKDIDL